MSPDILLLAHRDGLNSIFESVVAAPASKLSALGYRVDVVVFATPGELLKPSIRRRWRKMTQGLEKRISGHVYTLPGARKSSPSLRWESLLLRAWGRWRIGSRATVIFCSGTIAGVLGCQLRDSLSNCTSIYHSLGPDADEFLYAHGIASLSDAPPQLVSDAHRRLDLQSTAYREADGVITISAPMREHAIARYGVPECRLLHAPCFVDSEVFANEAKQRDETRRVLGVGDCFVVGYCGSTLNWQLSAETISLLHVISRHQTRTVFLGLTQGPQRMKQLLLEAQFPLDRATIVTLPWQVVPRYLAACDLGILGRGLLGSRHIVNLQSSPIKFGEYLASGTPVLMSDSIGDFSAAAAEQRLGVVLTSGCSSDDAESLLTDFIDDYQSHQLDWRLRCMRYAREVLDINKFAEDIGEFALNTHNKRFADRARSS